MNPARILFRPLYWLAGKIFSIWAQARPSSRTCPRDADHRSLARRFATCSRRAASQTTLALERACKISTVCRRPPSLSASRAKREGRRVVVMRRMEGIVFRRPSTKGSAALAPPGRTLAADNGQELLLIPVAIYWGRSPEKERSVFKLLFSENWDVASRTRKFFATLLLGRNTLLRYSDALPLSSVVTGRNRIRQLAYRKVSRILRVHFRQRRAATVGPDLSHRRTLVNQVLRAPGRPQSHQRTRLATIRTLRLSVKITEEGARIRLRNCREYQLHDRASSWRGLAALGAGRASTMVSSSTGHDERLHEVARDKEVIYVPCHRSSLRLPVTRLHTLRGRRSHPAHRGRHQSQYADHRADPAARRGVFPAAQLQGQSPVCGRLRCLSRPDCCSAAIRSSTSSKAGAAARAAC